MVIVVSIGVGFDLVTTCSTVRVVVGLMIPWAGLYSIIDLEVVVMRVFF